MGTFSAWNRGRNPLQGRRSDYPGSREEERSVFRPKGIPRDRPANDLAERSSIQALVRPSLFLPRWNPTYRWLFACKETFGNLAIHVWDNPERSPSPIRSERSLLISTGGLFVAPTFATAKQIPHGPILGICSSSVRAKPPRLAPGFLPPKGLGPLSWHAQPMWPAGVSQFLYCGRVSPNRAQLKSAVGAALPYERHYAGKTGPAGLPFGSRGPRSYKVTLPSR